MIKRETIIEKFSTFLNFTDYDGRIVISWKSNHELLGNMNCLVESDREAKENFWAQYFLKSLKELSQENDNNADRHLFAYLQEMAFWVSQKTRRRFQSFQHRYTWEDFFQIANLAASNPAKLFEKFDSKLGTINGYAQKKLQGIINDIVYQDAEVRGRKYSDWGLLRKLSKNEQKEALLKAGLLEPELQCYLLVLSCFCEIYVPSVKIGTRSLPKPTNQQIEQIAARYNQLKHRLSGSTPQLDKVFDKNHIEAVLETCIKAARKYLTVEVVPIDNPKDIPDSVTNLLDTASQKEEWTQVNSILSKAFDDLPDVAKTMLTLWHGLELTQAEIATLLMDDPNKQYQVARQAKRSYRSLLAPFAQWKLSQAKADLNICLTDDAIARMKEPLDEWLANHCKTCFYSLLTEACNKNIGAEEKRLLQLYYRHKWSEQGLPEVNLKQRLQEILKHCIETTLHIALSSPSPADEIIAAFVEKWLQTIPPEIIE